LSGSTGASGFEAEGRQAAGSWTAPPTRRPAGMLAAAGPAGLAAVSTAGTAPPSGGAIRLRLKEAVFAVNLARALRTLGPRPWARSLIVGGPAGDDELLGVLLRTLPRGRHRRTGANVGGTLAGPGRRAPARRPPSAWPLAPGGTARV